MKDNLDKDEPTICRALWHKYISGEITNEQLQQELKQFENQPGLVFGAHLMHNFENTIGKPVPRKK